MTRRWGAALFACAVVGLVGGVVGTSSCAQTPVNVPVRTFERAQKMDVVCLRVRDDSGAMLPSDQFAPVAQAKCAPVPPNANGDLLPYHLFALVTQTTRGEIAVVDLTRGVVVDVDHSTPGINFPPVGQIPTDVAVDPNGRLTYVSTA